MLKITKYNIPSIMLDNDMKIFNLLFKVIEKIDENATVQVHKALKGYKIIIEPSNRTLKKFLQAELNELSLILGELFEFSKTIDYSSNITFFTKSN